MMTEPEPGTPIALLAPTDGARITEDQLRNDMT
jgi:hypothetical protein